MLLSQSDDVLLDKLPTYSDPRHLVFCVLPFRHLCFKLATPISPENFKTLLLRLATNFLLQPKFSRSGWQIDAR